MSNFVQSQQTFLSWLFIFSRRHMHRKSNNNISAIIYPLPLVPCFYTIKTIGLNVILLPVPESEGFTTIVWPLSFFSFQLPCFRVAIPGLESESDVLLLPTLENSDFTSNHLNWTPYDSCICPQNTNRGRRSNSPKFILNVHTYSFPSLICLYVKVDHGKRLYVYPYLQACYILPIALRSIFLYLIF